jgi:hypothetical protein
MLLHGPRNTLAICLHDWEGYGCFVYGNSGLGRSTGYNNKTKISKIAFYDIVLCKCFDVIECACCLFRVEQERFGPRAVVVGFVLDKVAVRHFLQILMFSRFSSIPQMSRTHLTAPLNKMLLTHQLPKLCGITYQKKNIHSHFHESQISHTNGSKPVLNQLPREYKAGAVINVLEHLVCICGHRYFKIPV